MLELIEDENKQLEQNYDKVEFEKILWNEINALQVHFREIIILKDFQDYSYQEIADMLGVPIGTVMSRLYNARKKLKDRLKVFVNE